jgi:hypothetical protein
MGDFDLHRFEAHLEHFDNPNAGEAGNNFRAALKMCKEADLHFVEACRKFSGDTEELESLRRQLADAEHIKSAFDAAANRMEDLERQLGQRLERQSGLKGFFTHAWGLAGFRLVLAGAVFQGWLWTASNAANELAVNIAAFFLGLLLLWKWMKLEYLAHGFVQLLMRGLLFLGGLALLQAYVVPVGVSILAALLTLLTISKFTERLAFEVGRLVKTLFENPVLAAVKGWLI